MYKPAASPNDLEKFFVDRANDGDVEGLVALYEPEAVLISGNGQRAAGSAEIRAFFLEYLRSGPRLLPSDQAPAVCSGGLALTSSRHSDGGVSAEVARRQPDGSWLWVIDRFGVAGCR